MTNKFNTGLTYFVTLVLLSSLVITPVSISNSYWGYAFAEELTTETSIEYTVQLLNATSTESTTTETTTEPTTETTTEPVTEETTTEPVTEETTTESLTEETITEPESTTLELNGQGDFLQIANVTIINDLNGLIVTVWVKPDYSSGSPEFTVISKDKSFSLTINNNNQQDKIAKFSVFDGIKWTTVESTSVISEDWSFLSSTFNGELIAIFVDGAREATQEIIVIPTLSVNGKLQTVSVENITSEEDIVIGAW